MLVLHETLLVPVLLCGSETMLWKEEERLQLGLYRWTTSEENGESPESTDKGVVQLDEGIHEGVLQWFGKLEWRLRGSM